MCGSIQINRGWQTRWHEPKSKIHKDGVILEVLKEDKLQMRHKCWTGSKTKGNMLS